MGWNDDTADEAINTSPPPPGDLVIIITISMQINGVKVSPYRKKKKKEGGGNRIISVKLQQLFLFDDAAAVPLQYLHSPLATPPVDLLASLPPLLSLPELLFVNQVITSELRAGMEEVLSVVQNNTEFISGTYSPTPPSLHLMW